MEIKLKKQEEAEQRELEADDDENSVRNIVWLEMDFVIWIPISFHKVVTFLLQETYQM